MPAIPIAPALAAAALAATAALLPGAAAAETATGTVFEDRDGNGERGPDEPGVAGVAVSNGREVVRTDAGGRYSLPVTGPTVLFVTKPSGYAVPLDLNNLPRFSYVHDPDGSPPGLRYRGVPPTGPLPDAIDFALTPTPEPDRFTVIWLADPQPQSAVELGHVRDDVLAELAGTDAAFGVTAGDIMFDDLSLWPRYNRLVGRLGIPWYNVPGNHDLNYLAEDDARSLDTFKQTYGPTYYSFDYGRAHFVVLDNVAYEGRGADHPRGIGAYTGRIDDDQLEWLKNDLALVPDDRLVVLAMHIPLRTYLEPDGPGAGTANRQAVFDLLAGRPHLYAVAGHMHTTEHHYFGPGDGFAGPGELHQHVIATVSGSWWSGPKDARGIPVTLQKDGTPNGYYLMDVDGASVTMRYRAAGHSADHQLRITLDASFHQSASEVLREFRAGELTGGGPIAVDQVPSTEVLANLFDGGPRSRLTLEIGDGDPVEMAPAVRIDPYVLELFRRHPEAIKPWVRPTPSFHLWAAPLPVDLGTGAHLLTVRATDEFGQSHVAHRLLEVTE
ncbi:MAG TPA: calcineurin-like phosphoesterase family protein [Geminicoccaceae bacterium]|nr:calcineurin-like phosphoesterase family protein [Geminicoccaceae bacterium]